MPRLAQVSDLAQRRQVEAMAAYGRAAVGFGSWTEELAASISCPQQFS
jgi:hypothetical protein